MLQPHYLLSRQLSRKQRLTQDLTLLISRRGGGLRIEFLEDSFVQAGEGFTLTREEIEELLEKLWPENAET
ncbi:hypothetical protein RHJ63_08430 [Thermosynechococcus sp. JY1334]|uniref:hypothetical protein n=1 Tax=unclassified Thermosynechococcus TaxID=2622553 RepID=UPI002673FBB3|nr:MULTISPECIES: hypothetical protein [unclassified Thermosynechococcus]MDR7898334.1 hypothetical protein [Thermosynechococcus sp. JY1332]MDR7905735.1 hypothetical protein [Thermosynechococcus sp. JY1334]WKT85472.1 hypothetical protein QYC30_08455 [Thermosynechococcus sp. JY1339]WNC54418.1 hypothetical protein RHJ31_08445 [Thermosynechococcus sp. JY1331]